MPDQASGPGQDDEQATAQPGFAWAPGGPGAGSAPSGALDWQALLEALAAGGFLDSTEEDQEAAAASEGRMSTPLPPGQAGALAVEHMPAGPAQAGWLAAAAGQSASLDEYGLAGTAIAAHQLASWAQAVELNAVAQITARAADADPEIGLTEDGRPARLCRDAVGQVSMALMLTDYSATAWADLAITMTWRLPGTGAALAAGRIDLARAKVIAEAVAVLSEDGARAVEAQILPDAGRQTTAQLRVRLRRTVMAADPDGAEQRRQEAERHAKVSLYPDDDGTATLAGAALPAVEAAAAMARITAIARAMKAAGQAGGLDLHRARAMLGLLLGTLPYIPPPGDAPEPEPPGDGSGLGGPGPGDPGPGGSSDHQPSPGSGDPYGGQPADLPHLGDEDAPAEDGDPGSRGEDVPRERDEGDDDDRPGAEPVPPWPGLGAIPPALAHPAAPPDGRPVPGLLDVTLPWATLAGLSAAPGLLGRIGPITASQARQLAIAAETDPAAQWRIVVTGPAGQAITVTRIRRGREHRTRDGPRSARDGPPPGAGPTGRITLTISQDTLTSRPNATGGPDPPPIAAAALRAATRALAQARAQAAADAAAGGCAHHAQSDGYRPPPRLREHVTARDITCRNPTCRQPAWRADLDHTCPWDQGGRTCSCNLGGACRRDHQLKQHPRWKLEQGRPGQFTWTTPAGRTYITSPDTYPL
jgi:hypothetical protein